MGFLLRRPAPSVDVAWLTHGNPLPAKNVNRRTISNLLSTWGTSVLRGTAGGSLRRLRTQGLKRKVSTSKSFKP